MKEKPILFNSEMVQAILEGRKTQTRRVIKPQPYKHCSDPYYNPASFEPDRGWYFKGGGKYKCPFGVPGDQLWVRESLFWRVYNGWLYKADEKGIPDPKGADQIGWNNSEHGISGDIVVSLFMPKWVSRIQLKVKNIRVERVQDISESDARDEGVKPNNAYTDKNFIMPTKAFENLWNSINKKRGFGWAANPFVWVVEFEVMK